MEGPREVYRDERGNTFKATAEYAALRGWTLAEPELEPQAKARGRAANKARTVRARAAGSSEELQADGVEPGGELQPDQADQAENK